MVKFTREKDEILIELVKSNRILYDVTDENFKNNILKYKCWEKICAIVDVPVSECKKRWKSLRDQYNKKKKGDLNGAERSSSNWEYMNLMSFLSDTIERRESGTNCDDPMQQMVVELFEEQNTDEELPSEERDDVQQSQQKIIDEVTNEDPLNTEDVTVAHYKRRARRHMHVPMTKRYAQRSALHEKKIYKAFEIKTATHKFFESMADIVDKLPTHLQADVRLKVCQIVTEAELKHHTHHNQYSNIQSQSYNQFPYPNTSCIQQSSNINQYARMQTLSDKFKPDLD